MNGCDAGLAAMAGYEVFHVLPKWRFLVTKPMQTSGTTTGQATFWLAAFGAVYNCHRFTTGGHCSIQALHRIATLSTACLRLVVLAHAAQ